VHNCFFLFIIRYHPSAIKALSFSEKNGSCKVPNQEYREMVKVFPTNFAVFSAVCRHASRLHFTVHISYRITLPTPHVHIPFPHDTLPIRFDKLETDFGRANVSQWLHLITDRISDSLSRKHGDTATNALRGSANTWEVSPTTAFRLQKPLVNILNW
jgi:hypothetical protein